MSTKTMYYKYVFFNLHLKLIFFSFNIKVNYEVIMSN